MPPTITPAGIELNPQTEPIDEPSTNSQSSSSSIDQPDYDNAKLFEVPTSDKKDI